jgi:hypothetical protein
VAVSSAAALESSADAAASEDGSDAGVGPVGAGGAPPGAVLSAASNRDSASGELAAATARLSSLW